MLSTPNTFLHLPENCDSYLLLRSFFHPFFTLTLHAGSYNYLLYHSRGHFLSRITLNTRLLPSFHYDCIFQNTRDTYRIVVPEALLNPMSLGCCLVFHPTVAVHDRTMELRRVISIWAQNQEKSLFQQVLGISWLGIRLTFQSHHQFVR